MLSLVPGSERPHVLATGLLEHFVAYAGTGALLTAGYTAKRQLIGISVLLPVYAACLEILQIFVAGRNAQMIDAAAGTVLCCRYTTGAGNGRLPPIYPQRIKHSPGNVPGFCFAKPNP